MNPHFLILGSGYTGSRVAHLLEQQGHRVTALRSADFNTLNPETWPRLRAAQSESTRILHSIPVLRTESGYQATMPAIAPLLTDETKRVVYLSTTGIYGDAHDVNETTPVAPRHERGH